MLTIWEWITIRIESWYHHTWGCKHGDHRMKMSGCMYCGKR